MLMVTIQNKTPIVLTAMHLSLKSLTKIIKNNTTRITDQDDNQEQHDELIQAWDE